MIHGLDTGLLVAFQLAKHPLHLATRAALREFAVRGDRFALAPQIVAEFLHIVTDQKRFGKPYTMLEAIEAIETWWNSRDVDHIFPTASAVAALFPLLKAHRLGRKRLLDTLLGTTLIEEGIPSLLTLDAHHFSHFSFQVIVPGADAPRR